MQALGDILKIKYNRSPVAKSIAASMMVDTSNQVLYSLLGEAAKKYARAIYVKNKILTITCLSSVIAQEIKLNEKKLLLEINKKLGDNVVEKIRYLA